MMKTIIEAVKLALTDLFAGEKNPVEVINAFLTTIFSAIAEDEGFKYPVA